jgi:putative ABC transport system permease protein
MGSLWKDVRYGVRTLWKSPGFTAVAVVTLALGIGANSAIFSIVHAALLTPLNIADPSHVVMVWTESPERGWHNLPASAPDYEDWKNESGVFSHLGAFDDEGFNVGFGGHVERMSGTLANREFFEVLQIKPLLGRVFLPEESQAGRDNVTILTYETWKSSFNSDPQIIGRTIEIDGVAHTIVGVLPKSFPELEEGKLFCPMVFPPDRVNDRGSRYFGVMGRIQPGMSVAAAGKRLADLEARLANEFPKEDAGQTTRLQPIEDAFVEDVQGLLLVLFGVVGFVLLIACANVANLLLARGTSREKEMAIRAALGASRWALARQTIAESVVLALLGGALGILPAVWGMDFISSFGLDLPNAELVRMNTSVLAFALALSIFTGVLFGLAPAWKAWKTDLIDALKSGATFMAPPSKQRLRSIFVVSQVALTLVLMVGAGLMLQAFLRLRTSSPGYQTHGAFAMEIALSTKQYALPELQAQFTSRALEAARAVPGVQVAGITDGLPTADSIHGKGVHFPGRPKPAPKDILIALTDSISPGYLEAMHIPLLRGRDFTEADTQKTPRVVIVDQWSAQHYWPGENPIGKTIKLGENDPPREVVGVVGNVQRGMLIHLAIGEAGQVYMPFAQEPRPALTLVVRSPLNPDSLIPSVRSAVNGVDSSQPIFKVQTLDAALSANQVPQRLAALLLSGFGVVALLLATIGIYGVVAFTVGQRTREIGVRRALGAQSSDVLRLVLGQGMVLTGVGIAIGLVGAIFMTRVLASLHFGISPNDPLVFLLVAALFTSVSLLASWIPARRAVRVDPLIALRYE